MLHDTHDMNKNNLFNKFKKKKKMKNARPPNFRVCEMLHTIVCMRVYFISNPCILSICSEM